MPNVEAVKPEALEKFNHYVSEGINIYVRKILNIENELRFTLSKFLFLKSIEVHGIKIL